MRAQQKFFKELTRIKIRQGTALIITKELVEKKFIKTLKGLIEIIIRLLEES